MVTSCCWSDQYVAAADSPVRGRKKKTNTAYMYEYEIAKIILALWIGLNLTYGSLAIGLVIGSHRSHKEQLTSRYIARLE